MACDTCGKTGVDLESVMPDYQTDDIKQICRSCNQLISDHRWKVRRMQNIMLFGMVKGFMVNFRERNLK